MNEFDSQPPASNGFVSGPAPIKSRFRYLWLLVFVVIAAGVLVAFVAHHSQSNKSSTAAASIPPTATVNITKDGFSPQTITVKAGDVVLWKDLDGTTTHLIASNPYPKDDSLHALKSHQLGIGASYSYKLTHSETINYHDDLHPLLNGVIIVE